VFGTESEFGKEGDDEDGNYVATCEKTKLDVGIAVVAQAEEHNAAKHNGNTQQKTHAEGIEPHEIVAVHHDVRHHEHQSADEQCSLKVDAFERQALGHGAKRTAEDGLREQHERHGADGEDVHHLPCEMMAEPGGKPSAALDGGEQDDVEHGKEDGKIALGGNPKLDVAHALERALYLGHSGYEAHYHEHRYRLAIHCQRVAHGKHDGRAAEQLLVGEAELHAEEHREIDCHACKVGIEQEDYVLNHEIGGATDDIQCAEIDTAAELEAKGGQDVQPRLYPTRHPLLHHRHGKAHVRWRAAGALHKEFCQLSHYSSMIHSTL